MSVIIIQIISVGQKNMKSNTKIKDQFLQRMNVIVFEDWVHS